MNRNARRPLALTGWLLVVALCFGLWPQPSAAIRATVKVADENPQWNQGRFFRTGLALSNVGGVRLVPVKVQTQYDLTQNLPIDLSAHSSVAYNNRLFVIGGNTPYEPSPSNLIKSPSVFASTLADPTSGFLKPWDTLPELPEPISDAASIVVEVGGQSFLVVLGGSRGRIDLDSDLDQITSSKIRYYRLLENGNGNLTVQDWQTTTAVLPYEPDYDSCVPDATTVCDGLGSGARNLSAVFVTVAGTPYIYLFGGRNRVFDGNQYVDTYYSSVFKAPVSRSGSTLQIGPWERLPESSGIQYQKDDLSWQTIPLAGAATTTFVNPLDNSVGVYLVGGANDNVTYDANAYVARIDTTTGAVSWLEQGNMSDSRLSHAAVQSDGTITVSGGRTNDNTPTTSLAQGFINPEPPLTLYRDPLNQDAANFELSQGALVEARMLHRMEMLDGGVYGDWAYIIGGQVVEGNAVKPADRRVLVGNLDQLPEDGDTFVSDGKYYSKVFDFSDTGTQYFGLKWNALIATGQGIDMAYRVSNNPQDMGPLTTIPGGSQNGDNSFTLPTPATGRYIQFVASLTSGGVGSPTLSTVSLDVNRNGFPNISTVNTSPNEPKITPSVIDPNSPITLSVMLKNQAFDELNPSIAADWDTPGTFFVDLYVTPPGTTASTPVFGQTESTAYVEVNKALMGASQSYTIPSGNWRYPACLAPPCSAINWHGIFNQIGTYTIYIMVDSLDPASFAAEPGDSPIRLFGNVKEADAANTLGETDNIYGPFTVTVSEANDNIYLPLATNNVPSGLGAGQAPAIRGPRVHTIDSSR